MYSLLVHSLLITTVFAYNFGPPCIPERINYAVRYSCLENADQDEYYDRMARLRGEPSAFARTGFYDRLFRIGNTRARQSETFVYDPTYGYNPNLPKNGPYFYRYSNFFTRS
ncbi:unnamed protein product [Nippostrongylus brasiliensis]|uniref:Uncharacterized protein n=1 Tax=Nippostrongylus brasiliensis TaxID=27835 RepID=A0A0N4YCQ9_NIPBR|nr:hypothetical protein Q1695_015288 [Nippostrongylus brasiliensis]VDL77934.1 unnamed protein product [Nippostrongylus brasiliensis]